jgi:hypothetical protein
MTFTEVRKRVDKVNRELLNMGYSITEIEIFWNQILEQVKGK